MSARDIKTNVWSNEEIDINAYQRKRGMNLMKCSLQANAFMYRTSAIKCGVVLSNDRYALPLQSVASRKWVSPR